METLASQVQHLTLTWIKAHVGTEGNEQEDQAAKEGADMFRSVKNIHKFIQHPLIHSLMTYDTQYNNREIKYIENNYSL